MTKKVAKLTTGGLGKPSKMPGKAYGLPAKECLVGSRLHEIEGSTCRHCYALKGQYVLRNVQDAQYRRLASLNHAQWVDAMVTLITGEKWFRWHDSGDLQSVFHLRNIVLVCEATPKTHHWLPTREYRIVSQYRAMFGEFPSNLTVRLSAHMVDVPTVAQPGTVCSMVSSSETAAQQVGATLCKAYQHGNECRSCRACWSRDVVNVTYLQH